MSDYTIGPRSLRHVCPNLSAHEAEQLAKSLGNAMHAMGITSKRRAAAFIAQTAHESGGFRYRREIWGPNQWQVNYNHMLGNNGAADAYAYRGGGWIQLTGKSNYRAAAIALDIPLLGKPHLMNQMKYCSLVSAWWWKTHGLNTLADKNAFLQITKTINGGTNGLASRLAYWAKAKTVARYLVPRRVK